MGPRFLKKKRLEHMISNIKLQHDIYHPLLSTDFDELKVNWDDNTCKHLHKKCH